MRRAFAAEGLPLKVDYSGGGTVYLHRVDAPMGDFEVAVHPQDMTSGAIYILVMQGQKLANARNVFVTYDPLSSAARKARAALVRLRRRN